MRPKKRLAENPAPPEPTTDSIEADHELFLQAFEKPTQIYRYLRSRHVVLPVFLPRTLCYMKGRKSVSNKKRKSFKVDSLLATVGVKHQKAIQERIRPDALTVRFLGFYNHDVQTDADQAEVEIQILKNGHRKRKSLSSPASSAISLGKAKLPINPKPPMASTENGCTISHKFTHTNGSLARSAGLFLKVTCPIRHNIPNGICNGDHHTHDEPPQKRRKNGRVSYHEDDPMVFGAALRVYDRNRQCLLGSGLYQVVLSDLEPKEPPQGKTTSWLSVQDTRSLEPFEVFDKLPTVKFNLRWDEGSNSQSLDSISPRLSNHLSGTKASRLQESNQCTPRKRLRLQYIFQYGNGELMRQQTEVREDLRCPWCSLLCPTLFGLLKHLRLSHPRFNFIYVPQQKGGQIEVTVNDMYDGSYVGNPQDIHSHIGFAFSRLGPVRRSPITHVLVYRPKRPAPSLSEFLEPEIESNINRQIIQGHNRLYFHSVTCQPMMPKEIDEDSESENNPPWLYQKTVVMIDEFTDVNEGEKELMKMWNMHIMKHDYIADCQISKACFKFVEEHGREILEKNLSRNFLIHLVNLFDFSLIRPEVVQRAFSMLENLRDSMGLV